ncbi:MAG: hypothetical protein HZA63_09275 [Rhodocyclales bacterium]|nr:hypothetical protein [Rhodocyclales bacterium]
MKKSKGIRTPKSKPDVEAPESASPNNRDISASNEMRRKSGGSADARPTPIKVKRRPKAKLPRYADNTQRTMFNDQGYSLFNFETDARPVAGQPAKYEVAGIQVELSPIPRNPKLAMEMVLEAVALFHFGRNRWSYSHPMAIQPISLDSWLWKVCTVAVRGRTDDGTIRAAYSRPDNLDISLPHMLMWKTCGLGWLGQDHDCCARNFNNPTPWLGRTCGCP